MKKRIFEIIQSANTGDIASKIFDLFIMLLVIINSITIMIDTFSLPQNFKTTKVIKIVTLNTLITNI